MHECQQKTACMKSCPGIDAETVRLAIDDPSALGRAVELLRRGELVAFPTDTVYGVGAHALIEEGVARLFQVKQRPVDLPIPLLLPEETAMEAVCVDIPPVAWRLAARFWPGGLSLVLARSHVVPAAVTAGGSTVAVRVPDYPLLRDLCRQLGAPLAATSANLHGQPPPVTADEVESMFGGCIPLILDGGPCPGGVASTVLDLTIWPHSILRPGPVTAAQLASIATVR
jgi:L-threonylcarbamoyladenylate synthase